MRRRIKGQLICHARSLPNGVRTSQSSARTSIVRGSVHCCPAGHCTRTWSRLMVTASMRSCQNIDYVLRPETSSGRSTRPCPVIRETLSRTLSKLPPSEVRTIDEVRDKVRDEESGAQNQNGGVSLTYRVPPLRFNSAGILAILRYIPLLSAKGTRAMQYAGCMHLPPTATR